MSCCKPVSSNAAWWISLAKDIRFGKGIDAKTKTVVATRMIFTIEQSKVKVS
jgi:hypothetical protein